MDGFIYNRVRRNEVRNFSDNNARKYWHLGYVKLPVNFPSVGCVTFTKQKLN